VRRGLEDTLLVRVDGVVLMTPAQLATLVDAAGGVVVDVTTGVVTDSVLVAVGDDQRLAGAQAVAYASLEVDGRAHRGAPGPFRHRGAGAARCPARRRRDAGAALQEAGSPRPRGCRRPSCADVVSAAAGRAAAGNAGQVVLPTGELVAGGAARRGLDEAAARPSSRLASPEGCYPWLRSARCASWCATPWGAPGLTAAARDLLVADGLRFAGSGNAASFGDQPQTAVLVPLAGEDDRDRGEAVAAALGLDPAALQVNSETLVDTDVVVVLGDDFARAVAEQTTDGGTAPATPTSGEVP
jgi:hypothetical protein